MEHTPNYHDIHLPNLQNSFPTFNLQNSFFSHGLSLMSPNHWDPQTKTLLRPLRISPTSSRLVRISPSLVRVYGRGRGEGELSDEEEKVVMGQVRRMLRLSDEEENKVKEFHQVHWEAKESGFGRVFRSPSLFEDMVKAILFCNCQWPRTLSMAKALCDLQLELQSHPSEASEDTLGGTKSKVTPNGLESFTPTTPAIKEAKRKRKLQKVSSEEVTDTVNGSIADYARLASGISNESQDRDNTDLCFYGSSGMFSEENLRDGSLMMGNFPSPEELASLDENYLAKRCGLGYRAGRILKLAQGVVEGTIQLDQLEELSVEASLSNYNKVNEKLKEIKGFGPFTRGNVLMCLGFYNVVPTDSETIRHLKQVHQRTTTIQKVQEVVEEMYRRYEPYQFLAYWWEIWSFYEERFGKFSEMPSSDYKLVTASNMRTKKKRKMNFRLKYG